MHKKAYRDIPVSSYKLHLAIYFVFTYLFPFPYLTLVINQIPYLQRHLTYTLRTECNLYKDCRINQMHYNIHLRFQRFLIFRNHQVLLDVHIKVPLFCYEFRLFYVVVCKNLCCDYNHKYFS